MTPYCVSPRSNNCLPKWIRNPRPSWFHMPPPVRHHLPVYNCGVCARRWVFSLKDCSNCIGQNYKKFACFWRKKIITLNSISLWNCVFKWHPNLSHMWVCLFWCFRLILCRKVNTVCCGYFPAKEKVSILVLLTFL